MWTPYHKVSYTNQLQCKPHVPTKISYILLVSLSNSSLRPLLPGLRKQKHWLIMEAKTMLINWVQNKAILQMSKQIAKSDHWDHLNWSEKLDIQMASWIKWLECQVQRLLRRILALGLYLANQECRIRRLLRLAHHSWRLDEENLYRESKIVGFCNVASNNW